MLHVDHNTLVSCLHALCRSPCWRCYEVIYIVACMHGRTQYMHTQYARPTQLRPLRCHRYLVAELLNGQASEDLLSVVYLYVADLSSQLIKHHQLSPQKL